MLIPAELENWTEWRPLNGASRDQQLPRRPGLYRIRRMGRNDVDYIGQTGLALPRRLGMLGGVFAGEMPFRDPHTAAPALWALRQASPCEFEVSVTVVEGTVPWRKGLESVAIALYRQSTGASPTVEFGRMPRGFRASSPNNARLVAAGKRFHGGPSRETDASHEFGIPPIGPLAGTPQGSGWCGHSWSQWESMANLSHYSQRGNGLYRMRLDDTESLVYIGQGAVPSRPLVHLAKKSKANDPQGIIFSSAARFEVAHTLNQHWLPHHRLELENDLIAAHILEVGRQPAAQFLG